MEIRAALIQVFQNILNLDHVQIKTYLGQYSLAFDQNESIEKLRNMLKKRVTEEILKETTKDDEREFYLKSLAETVSFLNIRGMQDGGGYSCYLLGCSFRDVRHLGYMRHLKRCHPNLKNVLCNFKKKCQRRFGGLDALVTHLKQEHSQQPVRTEGIVAEVNYNVDCKCDRLSCGGRHFKTIKELMTHYNSFHGMEDRGCIFKDCKTTFKKTSPKYATNHFRIYHKQTGEIHLKPSLLLTPVPFGPVASSGLVQFPLEGRTTDDLVEEEELLNESEYDEGELGELEDDTQGTSEKPEDDDDYYLQYHSDYLNRLAHMKYIPHKTIQEIVEENILSSKKSLERREKMLRKSLCEINISEVQVEKVVTDVIKNDSYYNAQMKLNTEAKRNKFIKENEVRMGLKKEVFHYIPIDQSIAALLQDPSFNRMVEMSGENISTDEVIEDMKDGLIYKENLYFQANPEAYSILLYSDGVELKNPLGAARGSYKVVQVWINPT